MHLFLRWTLLALNVLVSSATREIVSFDFGWKHRTGLTDWAQWDDPPPATTDPGTNPPEATPSFDDSGWWDVQLPHDGLIVNPPSTKACPDGCSGRSYIPRHVLWYRKTFSIPDEWLENDGKDPVLLTLEFEGSFRNTTVWVNGELVTNHVCGYTPFRVPLSNKEPKQTIAVFVDPDNGSGGGPSRGSGWWYEGGGLYRHVKLVKTHSYHVEPNSLFVRSNFDTAATTDAGVWLDMNATLSIPQGMEKVCYEFQILHPNGQTLASSSHKWESTKALQSDMSLPVGTSMEVKDAQYWSTSETNLYQVDLALTDCRTTTELDRVNVRHGIRRLYFSPNDGFIMNDDPFKIRGFCDHDTFAVVGMAVPDRINLFRAQASRSIGGNGRRASHNPPDPTLLDIYDRLGIVVIDENRLFGGTNHPEYVDNMADLVRRDRNHPSVVVWSFCNEGSCEGKSEESGPAFQDRVTQLDGTRPTLANMFTFNDLLSNTIDIQGFSHQGREHLDKCHATLPNKPILQSECCSCNTMRGEDEGCETKRDNPKGICNQTSFNARCLEKLVNASDGVQYAAGTYVWTLFDYYGEPPSSRDPRTVSSTYGQFDLAGFVKAAAFWFRTQWLLGVADGGKDKPFPTNGDHEVYIVESWESPDNWGPNNKTKSIHAYTNAPFVELFLNNVSKGTRPVVRMVEGDGGSYAEWADLPWEPGTLTAVARSESKAEVAKFSRKTNIAASALVLSLDCPTEATGTGAALLLDGHDVALVRASIVDSNGNVMHMATNNITFSVVSGPGRIQGTANGNPRSYQPHTSNSQTAYHGLVRAVVRVTSTAGLPRREQELLAAVDGPTVHARGGLSMTDTDDILIEATSPGFHPFQIRVATTTDASVASVLSVAKAGAGKKVDFFKDESVDGARHVVSGLDIEAVSKRD